MPDSGFGRVVNSIVTDDFMKCFAALPGVCGHGIFTPGRDCSGLRLRRSSISVARQHGRADRDGVHTERRRDNFCRFKAGLKGAASGLAYDRLKDQLARFHDTAAQDYALDVQKVDDGGDRRACKR